MRNAGQGARKRQRAPEMSQPLPNLYDDAYVFASVTHRKS